MRSASRTRGIASGGIGLRSCPRPPGSAFIGPLQTGALELLKIHLPYHESGPCPSPWAYPAVLRRHLLSPKTLELLRQDEVLQDGLGAR